MGTLYLVATPIGNLDDMTFRAVKILKDVRLIACEDTRTSRVLLQHFGIQTPLTSYHEHNKMGKQDNLFSVLEMGGNVALISDAGTPAISDPGFELVREAITRGYTVTPIPGANAITTALIASGMPTNSFVYMGFLPKKASDRHKFLESLKAERRTLVGYESPHRLVSALETVISVMGETRQVCVAREMTKLFEEFFRGTAREAHQRFTKENPKGEITLVIAGAPEEAILWNEATLSTELMRLVEGGESLSSASKTLAGLSGWRKGDIYALGIDKK